MAESRHTCVTNHLHAAPDSIAEARRASKNSIRRLEDMIAFQKDRVNKLRHQSLASRSQTLRLGASMKDLLVISRLTLLQMKHSAQSLEISWAMLESSQRG